MNAPEVRAELVAALESILPSPWRVLAKTRQVREPWNPPVAVPGELTVEQATMSVATMGTAGKSRVVVNILFIVAIAGELDDAADPDELVSTGSGSLLEQFTTFASATWQNVRMADVSRVSDELNADTIQYRGATWTIELYC